MSPEVVVVDYGVGNIFGLSCALEMSGASVRVSSDPEVVSRAEKVVLPGVGAFGKAVKELGKRGLRDSVLEVAKKGNKLLGICLGMQLLLDESSEHGSWQGLGLIPGKVEKIPNRNSDGTILKLPHIGWSPVFLSDAAIKNDNTVFSGMEDGRTMYFLHSFMVSTFQVEHIRATCTYGDTVITAAISSDNVIGVQFHPEKSGNNGLAFLSRFIHSK